MVMDREDSYKNWFVTVHTGWAIAIVIYDVISEVISGFTVQEMFILVWPTS